MNCLILDACPLGRRALGCLIEEAFSPSAHERWGEARIIECCEIDRGQKLGRAPEFVVMIVRNWIFRAPRDILEIQQIWPASQIVLGDFDLLTDAQTRRRAMDQILGRGLSGFFSHLTPLPEITQVLNAAFQGHCLIARDSRPSANGNNTSSYLIQAYQSLTPRELEILRLLVEGLSNPEIAQRLGIEKRTVESHKIRIKQKFSVKNFASLVQPEIAYLLQLLPNEKGVAS